MKLKSMAFLSLLVLASSSSVVVANTYDPKTNQLTVSSVDLDGVTYFNVVITVGQVLSVESSAPAVPTVKIAPYTWTTKISPYSITYAQAGAYCNSLGLGWRLPSMQEASITNKLPLTLDSNYRFWTTTTLNNNYRTFFYSKSATNDTWSVAESGTVNKNEYAFALCILGAPQ